jgi:malate dehydrogenase (oxaloacetate-decarboxylating)(NADP+)
MIRKQDALDYHAQGRRGKIEVVSTKPVATQRDLSLAYSPGVAEPCREIHADPSKVNLYTARRNLVAVVTNGTAVLGLGNIGPRAAKPVMEGKGVLFKRFADIDVFDLEVDELDPMKFVDIVASLEPTFGGINLEDIRAPDCFVIERALRERMKVPVFHDDQHGTAIISAAALENAAEVQNKRLADLQVVCIGAGASAIACMELWIMLGVRREHIVMLDSKGVIRADRDDELEPFRALFAQPASDHRKTLEDAVDGADVLIGLSTGGAVDPAMLKHMADRPIIFALANPDPEIGYHEALAVRPDAIAATGRSDYPNQVNNVLGFPYIFRGALDVAATTINDPMKLAAAKALAALTREDVPDDVRRAYGDTLFRFGREYIIPKPFDARVLSWVAPAVARAAMESGVAGERIEIDAYADKLTHMLSPTRRVMWSITAQARRAPKRIVFPEGEEEKILRAAQIVKGDGVAHPILVGRPDVIRQRAEEIGVELDGITIANPDGDARVEGYVDVLWKRRQRKGVTRAMAQKTLRRSRTTFAMMMLHQGDADGLVGGLTAPYPETMRPALQIIGVRPDVTRAAGMYMVITRGHVKFLADTTVNMDPDAETLAQTAMLAADTVRTLGLEPRVAMLSFSNFGDAPHPSSNKVAKATALVKALRPDINIDGEMQANVALNDVDRAPYPFSTLKHAANVLIFPNLDAGNIAYKLLASLSGTPVVGPIVLGLNKPVNVLQQGASVDDIVHITAITVARVEAASTN